MPCCKVEQYKWCKDLSVVDYKDKEGKEYCVYHAPVGRKGISVEEFNELIFARINLAEQTNQSCDLSGTIFEWNIHFYQFNEANPYPVKFRRARFNGEADFRAARFNGEADFGRATFNEKADFYFAEFKKGADFQRLHSMRQILTAPRLMWWQNLTMLHSTESRGF